MELTGKYAEEREKVFEEDGRTYPGKALTDMELIPGYDRTRKHLLPYIRTINEAHLIMLQEQGIVKREEAAEIMRVIEEIRYDDYAVSEYDHRYEDLYFRMEAEIVGKTNGIGSNLHLARSRNDMCVAWSHLCIRDQILDLMEKLIRLRNTVYLFAEEHRDTLYVIHTHTQHAQPGLFGHYFLAMGDMIGRDIERLRHAYLSTNVSPMGAAAVTTSGFPISRERVAELAGFSGMIENSYDAIGNSDYFTETAAALGICALNLGRVTTDLVLWATEEMKMIRVADGYISTSSIMPQKRNPIALEHLRSSLSVTKGIADTVLTGFLKSPYGDISDYEDIEDIISKAFSLMTQNAVLMNSVLATMDVDKELLRKRAFESFSVVTEIADQIYRTCDIPFRQAHGFVAFLVKRALAQDYNLQNITQEYFSEAFEEYFKKPFAYDFEAIRLSMDPDHFVKSREIIGGTGPAAMEQMIENARKKVEADRAWLQAERERLAETDRVRQRLIDDLCG